VFLGFDLDSPLLVCHKCDNPKCFNPDHLFIGTAKDNYADMRAKGRRRNAYKLSAGQVNEIRANYHGISGEQTELAKKYGVHSSHISRIVRKLLRVNPC
jgi:hypothetical protein